jgi:transcriptional activator SPT8
MEATGTDADLHGSGSPAESTHSYDSLFGDDEIGVGGGEGDNEDDEMSQAIVNGLSTNAESSSSFSNNNSSADQDVLMADSHTPSITESSHPNGLHQHHPTTPPPSLPPTTSQTTFLASSMDGTLRLWDRRAPNPISTSHPTRGVPPWCMSACWSTDGNFVYAGRRNRTVEEYSVHRGLAAGPTRTLRFPQGSGSVSAVTPMPNGRHLICASFDNLRLYDLRHVDRRGGPTVPFFIVPGHHGGVVATLCMRIPFVSPISLSILKLTHILNERC